MYTPKCRLILLTGVLLFSLSCNDPLDNVTEYNFRIINGTDTEYNVYESTNEFSGGTFRNVDTIGPGDAIRRRLIVDVQYTFRLVAGQDPEQFDYQQVIQSPGEDITWSVP